MDNCCGGEVREKSFQHMLKSIVDSKLINVEVFSIAPKMLSMLWPEIDYKECFEHSKLRVAGGGNNPLGYGSLGVTIAAAVMESAQAQKRLSNSIQSPQQQQQQRRRT